jgi:hypothetical protein
MKVNIAGEAPRIAATGPPESPLLPIERPSRNRLERNLGLWIK